MSASPRFTIRLDTEERQRWEDRAKTDGLTLTAWIRRQCNGEPVATPPAETRRAKPIVATTDCDHPRGARVVINASLGLYRCGACGVTTRS